jgi:hypothetical protein
MLINIRPIKHKSSPICGLPVLGYEQARLRNIPLCDGTLARGEARGISYEISSLDGARGAFTDRLLGRRGVVSDGAGQSSDDYGRRWFWRRPFFKSFSNPRFDSDFLTCDGGLISRETKFSPLGVKERVE